MNRFKEYIRRRENQLNGKVNLISWNHRYPDISKYLPGISKGDCTLVTAHSGVGKTQLTKDFFALTPFQFYKENKDKLSLKIIYFALEESKEEFYDSVVINELYTRFGIKLDVNTLRSQGIVPMSKDTLAKVQKVIAYVDEFFKTITVVDTISRPDFMLKYLERYSRSIGTHYYKYKDGNIISESEYNSLPDQNDWVYSHYLENDPNHYTIVITDHISLLDNLPGKSLHETMHYWSAKVSRGILSKLWKFSVINVQQQVSSGENLDHIKSKHFISTANLADNKTTQRDHKLILGLYSPHKYDVKSHLGYDITRFKDNIRFLKILKNREGRTNLIKALHFDGSVVKFRELPSSGSSNITKFYNL